MGPSWTGLRIRALGINEWVSGEVCYGCATAYRKDREKAKALTILQLRMLYFEDLSVGMAERFCGHGKTHPDKTL